MCFPYVPWIIEAHAYRCMEAYTFMRQHTDVQGCKDIWDIHVYGRNTDKQGAYRCMRGHTDVWGFTGIWGVQMYEGAYRCMGYPDV